MTRAAVRMAGVLGQPKARLAAAFAAVAGAALIGFGCAGNGVPLQPALGSAGSVETHPNACPQQTMVQRADPKPARLATAVEREQIKRFVGRSSFASTAAGQFDVSMDEARAARHGKTVVTHDAKHGTQVSYNSPDGRIFLWYPADPKIWSGRWVACEQRFTMSSAAGAPANPFVPRFEKPVYIPFGQVCYQYGSGARWGCETGAVARSRQVDARAGDVFQLATRPAPPFDLPRDKTTIAALLKRR